MAHPRLHQRHTDYVIDNWSFFAFFWKISNITWKRMSSHPLHEASANFIVYLILLVVFFKQLFASKGSFSLGTHSLITKAK